MSSATGFPTTINNEQFVVLRAPTSSVYADRMKQVVNGSVNLTDAQILNVEDGLEVIEICRTSDGYALRPVHASLRPNVIPHKTDTLISAIDVAEHWWREAYNRREIILRRSVMEAEVSQ